MASPNIDMAISREQATESLKRYERYPIAEDSSTCYCASLFEIKKSFDSIIAECEDGTLGLCLACVKLGRLCGDEGNCEGENECCFFEDSEDDGDGNGNDDGNARSAARGGWVRGQSGRGRVVVET